MGIIVFFTSLFNIAGFILWLRNKRNYSRMVVNATKGVLFCLKGKGDFKSCDDILRRYKNIINKKYYKQLEAVVNQTSSGVEILN